MQVEVDLALARRRAAAALHVDDVRAVQDRHVDGVARLVAERLQVRRRDLAHLHRVDRREAEVEHARPEAVAAASARPAAGSRAGAASRRSGGSCCGSGRASRARLADPVLRLLGAERDRIAGRARATASDRAGGRLPSARGQHYTRLFRLFELMLTAEHAPRASAAITVGKGTAWREAEGTTAAAGAGGSSFRGGAGAGGLPAGSAAACGLRLEPSSGAGGSAGTIKIGFVSPLTGPAAGFGEPDPYVIGLAKKAFAEGPRDRRQDVRRPDHRQGQPVDAGRGAQVANDLIHTEGVDLMLATSTPETVNPVSDASEAAGVPCISTVVPWEAWYFGRGAKPGKPSPFQYTYHFCFGVAAVRLDLHPPVAAGADQQEGRRDVAERRRRQRDPRRASARC